jgi:hypothetical protein
MKLMIALFVFLSFTLPAAAQTPGGQIPDTVFGDDEKRIITDYLKKKLGLPETAKKSSSEKDDDEDEPKAKGKNKGKKKKDKGKNKNKAKNKKMPPGLAKRDELPPGLARHHTLPPGLQVRELPADLANQLPELEEGLERIIADESVVLIEKATGRILDVIMGKKP